MHTVQSLGTSQKFAFKELSTLKHDFMSTYSRWILCDDTLSGKIQY